MTEKTAEPASANTATAGTQAIGRATTILRLLARRGFEGMRLTQLTKASGLPHPTIRRILKCLITERLVLQNETTRRYRLGPLNYELGLATMRDSRIEQAFRQVLLRLARQSGDTVYLMVRGGADIVCLDLAEGEFPIRSHTFNIGGRRPLGFGAAGLALLSELDDDEIERVLEINAKEIMNHGRITPESLRKGVARTRERGYAVTSDVYTPGIGSVGRVIQRGADRPIYAINITTVGDERFTPKRIDQLQLLLKTELASFPTDMANWSERQPAIPPMQAAWPR
jgi:DNA-binding IclR family transcriptional regulator